MITPNGKGTPEGAGSVTPLNKEEGNKNNLVLNIRKHTGYSISIDY